jgi:molecular chaperone DnaK
MWRNCEDAKRTLSVRGETTISCDFRGHALPVKVTRKLFEERTAHLLERTESATLGVLKAAGLDWGAVDRVLLVGGSTRMPMVSQMLERISGKKVDRAPSPDEIVAHGAAIHAGLVLDRHSGRRPCFQLHHVNAHSLGVVGLDSATGEKRVATLIPRNTRLPAKVKKSFRTRKHGQTSVLVDVVEGESRNPAHCTSIGRCDVRDLPPNLPVGTPIDVTFSYDGSGRLLVRVAVSGTDKRRTVEIHRDNGLSKAELEEWRGRIARQSEEPGAGSTE